LTCSPSSNGGFSCLLAEAVYADRAFHKSENEDPPDGSAAR